MGTQRPQVSKMLCVGLSSRECECLENIFHVFYCPLNNRCLLATNVVYQSTITADDDGHVENYIGSTQHWKTRYIQRDMPEMQGILPTDMQRQELPTFGS